MVTLHEEIRDILLEHGREMTTSEIANEVNRRGNYHKRDGSPVTAFQVHGRTRNYDGIFTRRGVTVGLRERSSAGSHGATTRIKSGTFSEPVKTRSMASEEPSSPQMLVALPPVADARARVLVLGTMPGVQSLRLQQYYADPQNQFWRILFAVFAVSPPEDYGEKTRFLLEHGIALWDVLEACVRDGSLDVNIVKGSERPNNVARFLRAHNGISAVALNGGKAYDLFQRMIAPTLGDLGRPLKAIQMPSTSPAHTMNIERKLEQWRAILIAEAG